nr:alpha/beta hydrolase [Streptomyces sp. SID5468]
MPERPADFPDIEVTRARFLAAQTARPLPRVPGVRTERLIVRRGDGTPLTLEVYRPPAGPAGPPLPAVLHFHSGAFAYGRSRPGQDRIALMICQEVGAVAVAVEYRLAPEHPYPAGVDDCYLALRWVAGNAAFLGVDPARIAVTGKSAGACLSAAVALMARDRGGPALAHQALRIPLLDDRQATDSARHATDPRLFNSATVRAVWDHYLDGAAPDAYAAPARAADLTGLPATSLLVCDLDPARDEALDHARRLMDAGVAVTTRNLPGAWHLFELYAPETRLARAADLFWARELRSALWPPE